MIPSGHMVGTERTIKIWKGRNFEWDVAITRDSEQLKIMLPPCEVLSMCFGSNTINTDIVVTQKLS